MLVFLNVIYKQTCIGANGLQKNVHLCVYQNCIKNVIIGRNFTKMIMNFHEDSFFNFFLQISVELWRTEFWKNEKLWEPKLIHPCIPTACYGKKINKLLKQAITYCQLHLAYWTSSCIWSLMILPTPKEVVYGGCRNIVSTCFICNSRVEDGRTHRHGT